MFAFEQPLLDRLGAYLPEGTSLFTAPTLDGVRVGAQIAPAVHLIMDGSVVAEVAAGGDPTRLVDHWITVVAVRNHRDIEPGLQARAQANSIILSIYQALAGWKISGASKPIEFDEMSPPQYTTNHLFVPLGWRLEQVLANPSQI